VRRADKRTTFMCRLSEILKPPVPVQACKGIALPFYVSMVFITFSNTRTLFSPNCIDPLVSEMQNVSVYCGIGDDLYISFTARG